jgi:hypothetical protein
MPLHYSLQNLLKGWSPEKLLPLTLATDEGKPEEEILAVHREEVTLCPID